MKAAKNLLVLMLVGTFSVASAQITKEQKKGDKTAGIANLQKAKELGDTQAQTFIEQYSK